MRSQLELVAIESGLPAEYADFTRRVAGNSIVYAGTVEVPDIGVKRRIAIVFSGPPSRTRPVVMSDGPTRSRHRFRWARPTSLCIWYGRDHPSLRWRFEERLVGLIDMARVHLLKEYWWRATNSWESPEVHSEPTNERARRAARRREAVRRAPRISDRERCWCGKRRYRNCHGRLTAADELQALGLAARV